MMWLGSRGGDAGVYNTPVPTFVSLDVTPLEASDSEKSEGLDPGIGWGVCAMITLFQIVVVVDR